MVEMEMGYDSQRMRELITELREAREELKDFPAHARYISLAITDLESADNWLRRSVEEWNAQRGSGG